MRSFLLNIILCTTVVTAQYGGSGGVDYGSSYGSAAPVVKDDCVIITSTVQVTKTVLTDCCGGSPVTAYGAMGTAAAANAKNAADPVWGDDSTNNSTWGSSNNTTWSNSTVSSDGNSDNSTAPVVDQVGTECDVDSQEGADCSGAVGCCGNFVCDSNTLTCVSADSISLITTNSTTSTNGTSTSGGNETSSVSLTDNNATDPDDSEQGEAAPPDDGSDDGSDDDASS